MRINLARAQPCVRLLLPRHGAFAGGGHADTHHRRRLAVRAAHQVFLRQRRDFDLQVNAVEQRPGDARTVTRNLIRRAAAAPVVMTEIAAGTGVHRRNQLELRREISLVGRA